MCIAYTHDTHIFSIFIHSEYLHSLLFENERGWDFVLYHLFILFSSICLNEAVAQLTDEQRWWRHRVHCCSNCRYVLACSQVCAWSTDLPSPYLQVIESVVRMLGIEKRHIYDRRMIDRMLPLLALTRRGRLQVHTSHLRCMLGETARSSTHQEHFRVLRQYSLDACFELEQCSGNDWWRFTSPRAHEHAQARE